MECVRGCVETVWRYREAIWRGWGGCLVSVGRLSGLCGEALWSVCGGTLEGVGRLSLEGVGRLSGRCGEVVRWVLGV